MTVLQNLSMPSFIDVLIWNFITIYVKLTYKLYFEYSYYDTLLFETLTKEVTESTSSTLLICLLLPSTCSVTLSVLFDMALAEPKVLILDARLPQMIDVASPF